VIQKWHLGRGENGLMIRKVQPPQRATAVCTSGLLAVLLTLVITQPCDAFPVDFVLTPPGEVKQAKPEIQAVKEAPVDARKADDPKPAAGNKKPLKRGFVRQKAAIVAVGAAEAAEEVGVVLGDLINDLFSGGNRGGKAVVAKPAEKALKNFEAQYGRHFDQVVKTELHFIRTICEPTRQQYNAMATDGKLIRTKTIEKFALQRQRINRGIQSKDSNARNSIAEGLLLSAKRHLSADQTAIYERELIARKEAAKKVAILVTAGKLDRRLILDIPQRAQITKVLTENWNPSWGAPQMLIRGGQFLPDIPDLKITPILTATQKKVLKTTTQQSHVFWGFNVGRNQVIVLRDEEWDEEPKGEASDKAEATNKVSDADKPGGDNAVESVDAKQAETAPEGSK
jgi:hypothetical protein